MTFKILVLGVSGDVGRPLVEELVKKETSVKAASRAGRPMGGAEGIPFYF